MLQLAKYDQNYDIRDRARFLKFLLFPGEKNEVRIILFNINSIKPSFHKMVKNMLELLQHLLHCFECSCDHFVCTRRHR